MGADIENLSGLETPPAESGVETPDEQVVEWSPEGEPPSAEPAAEDGSQAQAEEPREVAEPAAAENLPREVTKLLRELSEAHPDNVPTLKALRNKFFEGQEFEKVFPKGTDEARALKATFEAVGGQEGLAALHASAETLRTIDEKFDRGDASVLEAMIAESPEGFKKLVPAAVEKLERLDPAAYDSMLRGPVIRKLLSVGLAERLQEAGYWMKNNQPEFAAQKLAAIMEWLDREGKYSTPEAHVDDPREKEFSERQAKLSAGEDRVFEDQVGRETVPHLRSRIEAALGANFKAFSLSQEAKSDLLKSILYDIQQSVSKDSQHQATWKALVRGRDVNRAVGYAKGKIDSLVDRISKQAWTRRYGTLRPSGKPAIPGRGPAEARASISGASASGPGTMANPLRLPRKPPDEQIDRSDGDWQVGLLLGKAKLKTGKYVTWPQGRA